MSWRLPPSWDAFQVSLGPSTSKADAGKDHPPAKTKEGQDQPLVKTDEGRCELFSIAGFHTILEITGYQNLLYSAERETS